MLAVIATPLPIHPVNGAFLGCIAPAGHSRLHVRYQPRSILWGAAITTLAIGLLIGAKLF